MPERDSICCCRRLNGFSEYSARPHLVLAGANERDYETRGQADVRGTWFSQPGHLLTGLITGQDKLAVLQDSDVFVMPSRSEGVSIAMLEAMYIGLPVIVTDRVGI